jgi:hypothetical protein
MACEAFFLCQKNSMLRIPYLARWDGIRKLRNACLQYYLFFRKPQKGGAGACSLEKIAW